MNKRLAAALLGAGLTLILIVAVGHGDVERMTYGDGLFYRYVAQHLDASPAELDPLVAARGPAMRYGRIVLPAATWVLSAGQPSAMRYVQPSIMVISGAAIAAMASEFLPGFGLGAAMLPFFALGLSLSLSGGYAEPVAAAFGMGACLCVRGRRWGPAAVLLALAMLTRESAFVFLLIGKALFDFPVGVVFVAGLHLILAARAIAWWRRSLLGAVAAGTAFQIVFFPLLTWHYLGDAFRTFTFLELMTILALAAWSTCAEEPHATAVPR